MTVQPAASAPLATTAAYTLTAIGDGSVLTIGGASLTGAQTDNLTLCGTPHDTTFAPTTDGSYRQAITDESSADTSRSYGACVTDGAGVPATFAFGIDRSFTVQNGGMHTITVAMTTQQVGSLRGDGASTTALAPNQNIAAPPPLAHVHMPLVGR